MSAAFVDSSCLVAIALAEPSASWVERQFARFDQLWCANLADAELRSVCHRESQAPTIYAARGIERVIPDRNITAEVARVLDAGYVRGADCWHLATALYVCDDPSEVRFLTLDVRQRAVAKALGFKTPSP